MSKYIAIPNSSNAIVEVATSAVLKTVLQVATPSTTGIRIVAWGITFKGTAPSAAPGICTLIDTNAAATVTSLTPLKWRNAQAQNSLCVGGTALTGYNASAEGSISGSTILDGQEVHPQTGYSLWYPDEKGPIIAVSRFLRIRTTFGATINCIPWILWDEPA